MIDNFEFKTSGRLVRLGNAINKYRNNRTAFMELTSTQSEAVRFILKNCENRLTAKDLMDFLKLSQSTVAGIIDRLCEKGFVMRIKHKDDRRKIILMPTDKGWQLDKQLRDVGYLTENLILQGMTDDEKKEFDRLIQVALSNMNSRRYDENEQ